MNTYKWEIISLDCNKEKDGLADVVITAHWICFATSSEKSEFTNINGDIISSNYTANIYGTQSFEFNPEKSFTPFSNLTQEQVIGWVQSSMGIDAVTALQESLDAQIDNQIKQPTVTPLLPWAV